MTTHRAVRVEPSDHPRYAQDFNKLAQQYQKQGHTEAEATKKAEASLDFYRHHYEWVYLPLTTVK